MAVLTKLPKHKVSNNEITIFSYNSCGFSSEKVRFMKNSFENCKTGIFAIQEHFLLKDNYYKLEQAFPSYSL